jgi:hypothetical protein
MNKLISSPSTILGFGGTRGQRPMDLHKVSFVKYLYIPADKCHALFVLVDPIKRCRLRHGTALARVINIFALFSTN